MGSQQLVADFRRLVVDVEELCNPQRNFYINYSRLKFVRNLGAGAFGEVMLMELEGISSEDQRKQRLVAVKRLLDSEVKDEFVQEMTTMRKLKHANLVQLLHVVDDDAHPGLVIEYLDGGSLADWLDDHHARPLDTDLSIHVLHSIANGMAELVRCGVVHRDLAARNGDLRQLQLTTRGLQIGIQTSRPLPLRWLAPEMLKDKMANEATDVYAYGVLMHELFEDDLPLAHLDDAAFMGLLVELSRKSSGLIRQRRSSLGSSGDHVEMQARAPAFEPPAHCPPALASVMRWCIDLNPMHRPTFAQLQDKWVAVGVSQAAATPTALPASQATPRLILSPSPTLEDTNQSESRL
ncbi:uncharacterized protein MONBRDRAFT_13613 [Monosiga brevicollis MX1]|uniref:Protein kinase domain-containing protein n=1 Tax=Monosiga brevicollis TaxID=81824 RepID=A9UP44_MONBE|nr:uncharacterized protein MONBRDRAFT_13613 [Monosiga brevicollis MX1]EDQ92808.1 predicted protein [Monosiga brevicollis MX1]|eukprot:XP_001742570.1 hypothetical protein [Monosiga brevicollis MX1]